MSREAMLAVVKKALPTHRYQHTLGVLETAVQLAERYGADVERAEAAAIFHDYAKYRPEDEMRRLIETREEVPDDILDYNKELWHAFVGAYLVQHEVGLVDQQVVDAIRYHTTGRPCMNLLEKVVYLADYIEPGRDFPGVDEVRQKAGQDLNQAVGMALKRTIRFLEEKGEKVYPLTRAAYADISDKKEESDGHTGSAKSGGGQC
ncbi:bis(5'-nucleosyl)-tetraphosphatase (symmetrical) YqeK [Caldalkalibacillus uzonensis]|uniref:bis(5'-nucleosyl)-tetraphosphatase (symmetrical) YqeK n=1 Tax=Caldalkalibacillus uzonensis TaxID=353224 RepID=UPI0027D7B58A|nr:bis(5'-nucleosyl)-tetraphosphatase (symmetrical) YqeK [Caldalkalibacillus uzonensis]